MDGNDGLPQQFTMSTQPDRTLRYSPEAYLELEALAAERHEYIDGVIRPRDASLPNHSTITSNLYASLNRQLRQKPYEAYVTDQRLWIPRRRIYTYPDVMVMAQPIEHAEGRRDVLINPMLIAEVLSDATQDYDQGGKFAVYRTISSFQEYLLISQTEIAAQHYVKVAPRRWTLNDYDDPQAAIALSSIACEITLSDLYDKVEFAPMAPSSSA